MNRVRVSSAGKLALAAAFLVWCCSPALAQTTFGSITGPVIDPSGAPVPGAQLTVTNENTNLVRHFTTEADGAYTVPDLEAGMYRVRVEAKGFSSLERPDLN